MSQHQPLGLSNLSSLLSDIEMATPDTINDIIKNSLLYSSSDFDIGGRTPPSPIPNDLLFKFDQYWKSFASKYKSRERRLKKKAGRKLIKARRKQKC